MDNLYGNVIIKIIVKIKENYKKGQNNIFSFKIMKIINKNTIVNI